MLLSCGDKSALLEPLDRVLEEKARLFGNILWIAPLLANLSQQLVIVQRLDVIGKSLEKSADLFLVAHRGPPSAIVVVARRRRFAAALYSFSVMLRHD